MEPIAVSVKKASTLVDRDVSNLYRQIKAGRLPAYRPSPGADWLIMVEDLRAWAKTHPVTEADHREKQSKRVKRTAEV